MKLSAASPLRPNEGPWTRWIIGGDGHRYERVFGLRGAHACPDGWCGAFVAATGFRPLPVSPVLPPVGAWPSAFCELCRWWGMLTRVIAAGRLVATRCSWCWAPREALS